MQAEDRVIHFCVELIHQPSPINRAALQKCYFDLSQTRANYDSIEVNEGAQARFYSNRGKAQSVLLFLPDRALVIEEWADLALSDFEEKVRVIMPRLGDARQIDRFLVHAATVRSTFALTHYTDSRVFLLDGACGLSGRITPYLQRPVATGGLRFVLPETPEHPGALQVNIESFRHSNDEMFVEVKGVYGRQQVLVGEGEEVIRNLRQVRQFVSERVYPFLQQFDQPGGQGA